MSDGGGDSDLPSEVVGEVAELPEEEAIALLRERGWWHVPAAMELADWALQRAETDATRAGNALHLAALIAVENGEPSQLSAQIAYAEARRSVHVGNLLAAEQSLLLAQEKWRSVDAHGAYARTFLGLTQVLSMQGRYADAGNAAQGAIDSLQPFVESEPAMRLLLSRAHRNRANLLAYQEQHEAAREGYLLATAELELFRSILPFDEQGELQEEFGHLALNLASAHTFLDAPDEAEILLLEAISRFDLAQDGINRGRAQTNLGRLYLRLGAYATALNAFDLATRDLIGELSLQVTDDSETELTSLRQADELLLEHALAYLSLNLLPEAALALERCERLFRATGQPYELAQCRYAQGVQRLQQGDWAESRSALDEALTLYTQLDNRFWRNRCQTALARWLQLQGEPTEAALLLDELLADATITTAAGALAWDLLGIVDLWLMRLQLWLDANQIAEAEAATDAVAALLGVTAQVDATSEISMPHLTLRLFHARGRIATARSDNATARVQYSAALELLDRQRAALPLEEVRTAFLDDKMALYSDLVLSLLAAPIPSDDEVSAAFAIVERARSHALLERLLASVESVTEDENSEAGAQRVALRRQLHWLYNQLLGESGNRRLDGNLGRDVAKHEAAIQQLEWRAAPLLAQVEPVRLAELQSILAPDQQALVYYFAGNEILAFVVGRKATQVVRHLANVDKVTQLQAELRFQMGRAELGSDYVTRNQQRLMRGVQEALGQLYQQLVAPLETLLTAERLLLIPYGVLHMIPFHALWVGDGYWLERKEIVYVPSASVAVHKNGDGEVKRMLSFAGIAPYDERIPQAKAEIAIASTYFEDAWRFCDQEATIANLSKAASSVDVLHLATHGLFRPDNSFFSALKLSDGWIDVREIYRLQLAAKLVVLSACESGVGDVRAGDEVVGLARGFLAAGAQHLIATLWNVHDSSAAQLMNYFYNKLQGGPFAAPALASSPTLAPIEATPLRPAAALRAAQINALQTGAHPYYWAPFFAIG